MSALLPRNTMKLNSDVDIDLGDRDLLLRHIAHTPASMLNVRPQRKHNTGVYVTGVPTDDLHGRAGIDYTEAERRGYFKLDLLNVHVYNEVRDEAHLYELMQEPDWSLLLEQRFFQQVIHIGNHFRSMTAMPEPINSIPRMAMFLAIIRPGKKHLIGKPWSEVAASVWERNEQDDYTFKKSHSVGYAHLAVVHMNLLTPLWHSPDKRDATFFGTFTV